MSFEQTLNSNMVLHGTAFSLNVDDLSKRTGR
jgi:hypothetical protein